MTYSISWMRYCSLCVSIALVAGHFVMSTTSTALAGNASSSIAAQDSERATAPVVSYKSLQVGDVDIFYREAGPKDAPVLLLLHGYPSSSHMFRDLIPRMATHYRVIAPDLPGFGSTKAPPRADFDYTFDNLAKTMEQFTEALGLQKYAMYMFDYGAPIGFRLATAHPERITAIISQNGNIYEEGLTAGWAPIQKYWNEPTSANRAALKGFQTAETTRWQYTQGVPEGMISRVSPDGPAHDYSNFTRPEGSEIQLDLFGDYKTNVALYPAWQEYLRREKPPVLAVWGKNDPFFAAAGAKAFERDIPGAEVILLDTGHFALETHANEIAGAVEDFLTRTLNR